MNKSENALSWLSTPDMQESAVLRGVELSTSVLAFLRNNSLIDREDTRSLDTIFDEFVQRVKQEPRIYVAMKRILLAIKTMIEALMVQAPREKLGKSQFDLFVPFSSKRFFTNEADRPAVQVYEKVVTVIRQYENYSCLNDEEIEVFKSLSQLAQSEKAKALEDQDRQVVIANYAYLQEKFSERADQEFLHSLHKVHWFMNAQSLSDLVRAITVASNGEQWELSTVAYDQTEQQHCMWGMGIGIELQGETIWAANSDSRSDNRVAQYPHRKFSYGDAQGMILGPDSYLHSEERIHETLTGPSHNELIVRNWNPVAFVVDVAILKKQLSDGSKISERDVSSGVDEVYGVALENLKQVAEKLQIEIRFV